MNAAFAHRLRASEPELCIICSVCGGMLPAFYTPRGTTLLELRCNRCGTQDIYHVNALRPVAGTASRD